MRSKGKRVMKEAKLSTSPRSTSVFHSFIAARSLVVFFRRASNRTDGTEDGWSVDCWRLDVESQAGSTAVTVYLDGWI
jgi:hypothetical protein